LFIGLPRVTLGNPEVLRLERNTNALASDLGPEINRAARMPDQIFTDLNPVAYGLKMSPGVPFVKKGGQIGWSTIRNCTIESIGNQLIAAVAEW
jgi:hypothetical protein